MVQYIPRIKPRGFLPNPIAHFGVPDYANTATHPQVEGTQAWKQWWEEQFYYCINGYDTAGIHIWGRFYYFLNFCTISSVGRGVMFPEYYDLAHEIFDTIKYAKENQKGVIGLKARRKGYSFDHACGVIDYGLRFIEGYKAALCAGAETHINDFYEKLMFQFFLKHNEMKMHLLTVGTVQSETPLVTGYKVKTDQGWESKGGKHTLHLATMYRNPNKMKGKYLHDQIFEESGEFPLLEKTYSASKDCWMEGDMMIGTPFIYGTAGDIKSSSRDFKKMWHEPDTYNLVKIFTPAMRMYFPCTVDYRDRHGVLKEDIPYLKQKYTPEERYGMEDTQRALERINKKIEDLNKNENKEALYDYLQNNPRNEKEAFLQFSANNFEIGILNDQMWKIETTRRRIERFRLDFILDNKGKPVFPYKVKAEPDREKGCWLIHCEGHPKPRYRNLDIAGFDSYNQSITLTSKSLGAMVVYRRKHTMEDLISEAPIGLLYYRPPKKEDFYLEGLKGAIYWNLLGNVLFDAASDLFVETWKQYGGLKFLADRPKKFDSPNTQQVHDKGVKLTTYSKPLMLGLVQTWVYNHCHKCWFPEIIQDTIDYDEKVNESDWDATDALGLALMRNADMGNNIIDEDKLAKENPYAMPEWVEDANGNIVSKRVYDEAMEDVTDPFLRMFYSGELTPEL